MSDAVNGDVPRLAAVVFTDVVGYSAHMHRDEAGTIRRVRADLDAMRRRCAEQGGETLNTMGDGMMAAFPSALKAVTFALQVQEEFAQRNKAAPPLEAMQHRIGVHLGDVFRTDEGGLTGDGVNIASRLEGDAPHGGVAVSQTVHDTVKKKIPLRAHYAGERHFKNIDEPIPVWHLLPPSAPEMPGFAVMAPLKRMSRRTVVATAVTAGVVAAGAGAFYVWRGRAGAPASAARSFAPDPVKSIAVLPFANLSEDKDTTYFADGIHEDLLTQLGSLSGLKVVSRTTVMEYRKPNKSARQIAKELGVPSLVEGSVRRAGNQVRVTAQLIDAGADRQVWARNFDRELKDVFAVQSELATEIARALQVSLTSSEQGRLARRPTDNLEAYELFLKHQQLVNESQGSVRAVSTVKDRIALLDKAVSIDPRFALAWARLGAEHARMVGYDLDPNRGARRQKAQEAIDRALALAPDDPQVKIEQAAVLLQGFGDHARAMRAFEQVLAQAPYNIDALEGLAEVHNELGNGLQAVALLERGISVDGRNVAMLTHLAGTYQRYRHFDRAIGLRRNLLGIRPDDVEWQARLHYLQYLAGGSWADYDAWRSSVPKGAEKRFARVRNSDAERAIVRRDWPEVHRLIDLDVDDFKRAGNPTDAAERGWMHALAHRAAGDAQRAASVAKATLALLDAHLKKQPGDSALLEMKAQMHAALGQREPALAAFQRAVASVEKGGDRFSTESIRQRVYAVQALLGDTAQALEGLARQVKRPGFFVHEQRMNLPFASLFDDPGFASLVNDPASNAPLPLETPLRLSER